MISNKGLQWSQQRPLCYIIRDALEHRGGFSN